ncbi:MAG: hypothetical protein WKF57_17230 [Nakamurella sp.]
MQKSDIVTVRAEVHDVILKDGELIGPESDDALARYIPIEVADVHVSKAHLASKNLAEIGEVMAGGVTVHTLVRAGPV